MIVFDPPIPEGASKDEVLKLWSELSLYTELLTFFATTYEPKDLFLLVAYLWAAIEAQLPDHMKLVESMKNIFAFQYPAIIAEIHKIAPDAIPANQFTILSPELLMGPQQSDKVQ